MTPSRLRAVLIVLIVFAALAIVWTMRRRAARDAPHEPSSAAEPTAAPTERPAVRHASSPSEDDVLSLRVPLTTGGDAASQGRVVAHATWGSGPGQLGRDRPQEGNPEAPMAFVQDPSGGLVVLDQVNHRLVRFGPDGRPAGTTPLAQQAPQGLAIARNGTVAVLDRLGQPSVSVLTSGGQVNATLPLVGTGLTEGGGVTGLFVDGNDVYAEREHGSLVHLGDLSGNGTADRSEIPGRPSRDGQSYISAGLIDRDQGRLYVNSIERATNAHRYTRDLSVALVLETILVLDTDRAGVVYVAVQGVPTSQAGAESPTQLVSLLCLDPRDGHPLGSTMMPANTGADETFADITVLDGGGVIEGVLSDSGESFQQFDCRGN